MSHSELSPCKKYKGSASAQQIIDWIIVNHDDEKYNKLNVPLTIYNSLQNFLNYLNDNNILFHYWSNVIQINQKKCLRRELNDVIIPTSIDISVDDNTDDVKKYFDDLYKKREQTSKELNTCISNTLNINAKHISSIISNYVKEPICVFKVYVQDVLYYKQDIWEFPCKLDCPIIPICPAIYTQFSYLVEQYIDCPENISFVILDKKIIINDSWSSKLILDKFFINDFLITIGICVKLSSNDMEKNELSNLV